MGFKKLKVFLFVSNVFLLSSVAAKDGLSPKVFYGSDDRRDYFEVSADFQTMSEAVLALVDEKDMSEIGQSRETDILSYVLSPITLKEQMRLCNGVRFAEQIAAANCTAFLISENVAVTAGHCITSMNDCKTTRFIQNYKYNTSMDATKKYTVTDANMTKCTEILAWEKNSTGIDFAVVRLEKKLSTKFIFKFRTEGKVADRANLMVVGHPSGLPLKYTSNAIVRNNTDENFFAMEADTFGGNSGSPVVDPATGTVEGILVRGERDYAPTAQGCQVVNECGPGTCKGEDAVRITKLPLKALGLSHSK